MIASSTPATGTNKLAGPLITSVVSNAVPGQVSPEFYTTSGVVDETTPWATSGRGIRSRPP